MKNEEEDERMKGVEWLTSVSVNTGTECCFLLERQLVSPLVYFMANLQIELRRR